MRWFSAVGVGAGWGMAAGVCGRRGVLACCWLWLVSVESYWEPGLVASEVCESVRCEYVGSCWGVASAAGLVVVFGPSRRCIRRCR